MKTARISDGQWRRRTGEEKLEPLRGKTGVKENSLVVMKGDEGRVIRTFNRKNRGEDERLGGERQPGGVGKGKRN